MNVAYNFNEDVYMFGIFGIGLFYILPQQFVSFVLGCLNIIEQNHPELLPGSDIDAIEQVKRIFQEGTE